MVEEVTDSDYFILSNFKCQSAFLCTKQTPCAPQMNNTNHTKVNLKKRIQKQRNDRLNIVFVKWKSQIKHCIHQ